MSDARSRPMKILYFAWLKDKAGMAEETVDLPAGVSDVDGLIGWLRERGGGPAAALADLTAVRVAVNLEYVRLDHPLCAGDEVAFFPPVTGGAEEG
jgi:molybdopterin synthase sulfur carrier subunit